MSGTIFGLPMSQRVDSNGDPEVGWLLYLFQANTSTPVNSYQDTGLTVLNTWPIAADSFGMMKVFWLADGSYRVRGTSADGSVVFYDLPNVLAIGASTGAPPPSGVDPTAIFQTGDVIWVDVAGSRAGWVRDNGLTIGSATSGATERANADCQALFGFLWNTFSNAMCPVSGGRGGSSSADWTANKQIQLPDKRGFIPGGLDDMGNTAAARWGFAPIITGSPTTPGSWVGEPAHTLATGELPAHTHSGTTATENASHTHVYSYPTVVNVAAGGGAFGVSGTNFTNANTGTESATHAHTFATDTGTGGGGAHNNAQYTVLGSFYRKL